MGSVHIDTPAGFTTEHARALGRYLRAGQALSADDWACVLEATDLLRNAVVSHARGVDTFASLYNEVVDAAYGDTFIDQLVTTSDPVSEGEKLRAGFARQILRDLRHAGLYDPAVRETQLLATFCVYWWQAFTAGYAFELETFRDLASSGINFDAHNIRRREERLSPADLTVMGHRGDVKTSTYFLAVRRTETLAHDFYLTRLYDPEARARPRVVVLRRAFWDMLDGDPVPATWDRVWHVLPDVALVTAAGRDWVVAPYDTWKARVREHQKGGTP